MKMAHDVINFDSREDFEIQVQRELEFSSKRKKKIIKQVASLTSVLVAGATTSLVLYKKYSAA